MTKNDYKEEFYKLRTRLNLAINNKSGKENFADFFTELSVDAMENDPVAQDFLGWLFKHGVQGYLPENFETSQKWFILAGSNGNSFSLDRLMIYLNYAIDEIVYNDDFGLIKGKNNLNSENYVIVLGKYVCDGIADKLGLDAKLLAKQKPTGLEFSTKLMYNFDKARNIAIPTIIEFLKK
ncbi:MAG: hypothetical protein RR140_02005 [Clostridia bacterium]